MRRYGAIEESAAAAGRRRGPAVAALVCAGALVLVAAGKSLGAPASQKPGLAEAAASGTLAACIPAMDCQGRYDNVVEVVTSDLEGMTDRSNFAAMWASIAVQLCARVSLPPPCECLSSDHTEVAVSCDFYWDAYYQVEPSLFTPVRDPVQPDGALLIDETLPFDTAVALASAAVQLGDAFVWRAAGDHATNDINMVKETAGFSGGCDGGLHATYVASETAASLADGLFGLLPASDRPWAGMHLRRGDVVYGSVQTDWCPDEDYSVRFCDTASAAVERFATCAAKFMGGHFNWLVFTDETDEDYVAEVLEALEAGGATALWGDRLVEAVTRTRPVPQDNYFVYAADLAFEDRLAFVASLDSATGKNFDDVFNDLMAACPFACTCLPSDSPGAWFP